MQKVFCSYSVGTWQEVNCVANKPYCKDSLFFKFEGHRPIAASGVYHVQLASAKRDLHMNERESCK